MSNETLDEAGVLAKFGVRADQVLDLLTLTGDAVDNVPGVPKVGPKTAAKWLAQYGTLDDVIAHAGEIGGVVGENLRDSARLAAAGQAAAHGEDRLRAAASARRSRARRARCANGCDELYERFEFKQWLREGRAMPPTRRTPRGAIAEDAPRRDDAGRRFDDRGARRGDRARRRPPTEIALRNGAGRGRARALARTRSTRAELVCVRHRDDEPRSDERAASSACRSRSSRAARATSRSRIATPARPTSSIATASLARLAPWFADASRKKLGQNVKYDQHALANHGLALARRRARHAAPVVRARVAQAARHGQPRVAASRPEDDHATTTSPARARTASASTRWRSSARPSTRPRTSTSRCGCTTRCIRAIAADAKLDAHLRRRSRCRCAKCCSAWSATAS